jgi:hypothetical protein
VRRSIEAGLVLLACTATPAGAGTFNPTPIAPDAGVTAITRGVAQAQLGRAVFSNPYATVTLGSVDVYGVFPYVESRRFQIVSDPAWNRLVFGEIGKGLSAFDGRGSAIGALSAPRGLAVDDKNRVYVADSGNDRIVVFQAVTEFDAMTLVPAYEVRGLHQPYDVAVSDRGTPFDASDDRMYVADTGRNDVVAFALEEGSARRVASIGELGSGPGRFAGPMAIAAGRRDGVHTEDVYVADAHNGRIVRLRDTGSALAWVEERKHDADVVTSLDTDPWGNVYAAMPNRDRVEKFNAALAPVATLRADGARPKSFHVPYLTVTDHRTGTVSRTAQAKGVLVESWTDTKGLELFDLGLEVADLAVVGGGEPQARFLLTDRANVTVEVKEAKSGRTIARRAAGMLDAGLQTVALAGNELAAASGGAERVLRVSAVSAYPGGAVDVSEASFRVDGGGEVLPPQSLVLLSNIPNPVAQSTRLAFLLPAAPAGRASLRVLDARGRLVRTLEPAWTPGLNEVEWDGNDAQGRRVAPGVYFSRLVVGPEVRTGRLVVIQP